MTRTMQDSDLTSGFTAGADIYAGYVLSDTGEGHNNYASMVARFPGAKHLSICTRFNASAQVLDFEAGTTGTSTGDAQQAVAWVTRMRAQGIVPSVYVQLSLWDWLASFFTAARVVPPCWWVAHWTGAAHLEAGSDATQWKGGSQVDLNTVADFWPTIDGGHDPSGGGTPIPTPPTPTPEDDMSNYLPLFIAGVVGAPAGGELQNAYYLINDNNLTALHLNGEQLTYHEALGDVLIRNGVGASCFAGYTVIN